MDLHSVNYLHYGAPKYWYCIPPDHRDRFEAWVKGLVPDCFRECSEFIRHKVHSRLTVQFDLTLLLAAKY
jgi:jumonji domain-containing protein 2